MTLEATVQRTELTFDTWWWVFDHLKDNLGNDLHDMEHYAEAHPDQDDEEGRSARRFAGDLHEILLHNRGIRAEMETERDGEGRIAAMRLRLAPGDVGEPDDVEPDDVEPDEPDRGEPGGRRLLVNPGWLRATLRARDRSRRSLTWGSHRGARRARALRDAGLAPQMARLRRQARG